MGKLRTHAELVAERQPLLTARENEVALFLAIGMTNREIATELNISIKTIDTHRGHILAKLRVKNNVALARYAIRVGAVGLDEDHPILMSRIPQPDLEPLDPAAMGEREPEKANAA